MTDKTDTTTFTLRLNPRTHEAIRYIAAVRGEAMHIAAAHLLARGISALRADPEWQAKAAAHEAERAAGLAMLGVAPEEPPLDDLRTKTTDDGET